MDTNTLTKYQRGEQFTAWGTNTLNKYQRGEQFTAWGTNTLIKNQGLGPTYCLRNLHANIFLSFPAGHASTSDVISNTVMSTMEIMRTTRVTEGRLSWPALDLPITLEEFTLGCWFWYWERTRVGDGLIYLIEEFMKKKRIDSLVDDRFSNTCNVHAVGFKVR